MKKLRKIAASIMAIAAMTTNVTGISASAIGNNNNDEWMLRNVPGAPSSVNNYTEIFVDVAQSTLTSMYEECTQVNFCVSPSGQTSGARYRGYYEYTDNGTLYRMVTFTSIRHNTNTGGGIVQ